MDEDNEVRGGGISNAIYLILYFISFVPFYAVLRQEKTMFAVALICAAICVITNVVNSRMFSKISMIAFLLAVAVIAYLVQYPMLFMPLSMAPFIMGHLEITEDGAFSVKTFGLIVSISAVATFLLTEPPSGVLEEEILFAAPCLFAVISFIIYYHFHDTAIIEEAEKVVQDIESSKEGLKEEVTSLKKQIEYVNKGLERDSYLAVVMGLEFDSFDYSSNIQMIVKTIYTATKSVFTAFYTFDTDGQKFVLYDKIGESSLIQRKIKAGIGIVGSVYSTKRYAYTNKIQSKEHDEYKRSRLNGVDSFLALPIVVDDQVVSAIAVGLPPMDSEKELDIVNLCAMIANRSNIEFAKMKEHRNVQLKAITDKMTGLYNRLYFDGKIQELFNMAQSTNRTIAYVEIDLDFFKQMNDTHGHAFGDKVLQMASAVFKQNIRKTDFAFRTGGDEFALILVDADKSEAYNVAKNIKEKYAEVVEREHLHALKDGKPVKSSFSIGISVYPHEKANSVKELMDLADEAVYYVKEHGKNNIAVAK